MASLKQRLLAGGMWVFIGKLITAGSDFVTTLLLVRLLSADEYGAYALAFSLSIGGTLLAQLGSQQAVVRLVAQALGQDRLGLARAAIGKAYRLCAIGCVAVAGVLALGGGRALALRVMNSPGLASVMVVVAAWIVVTSLQVLTSEVFRGFQDLFGATLFGGVISRILILLALGAAWLAGARVDLVTVIGICVGATAISLALGMTTVARRARRLPVAEPLAAGEFMAIAWPLWINGVSTFVVMQFDLWIFGAFVPTDQVAIYFGALRLVVLVSMSLLLVNLVVPPFIAELYFTGQRERLERVLRTTATLAGLPAAVVLTTFIAFGGPLLGYLLTEPYRAGAPVLALLSIGNLVNVLTGSCGVTMSMTGHQRHLMTITVATGVVGIVAALIVVRPYGMIGVAAVSGFLTVVRNLTMWLVTKRVTGLWTHVALPRASDVRSLLSRG